MNSFEDYKKARLGGKYVSREVIPGSDIHIGLKILTTQELLQAEAGKNEYLKSIGLEGNESASMLENYCQVLYRSAVDPDSGVKYFSSVSDVRQLTGEDLTFLADRYFTLTNSVNPMNSNLSEIDLEDVKKKLENGEFPIGLSYRQLQQALMVLVGSPSIQTSEQEPSSESE